MKLLWANLQPAIIRQSLDKSVLFFSADTKTTFFFPFYRKFEH